MAFEAAVNSVRSGLDALAGHHRDASGALRTYATALREAQSAANLATQDYGTAVGHYETTMSNLSASPPTGPGATTKLNQAESPGGKHAE